MKSDPAAASATPIYAESDVHHSQPHSHHPHHSHHYSGGYSSHHGGLDYGLHAASEADDSGGGGRLTGYDAAVAAAAAASNPGAFPPSPSSETSASTGIHHCSVFDRRGFLHNVTIVKIF